MKNNTLKFKKYNFSANLLCFITGLYWFSLYTYVPTLPKYSSELEANYRILGLILGSYGFTQMLIRIPLGIISDKIGKRKIFVSFGVLFSFVSSVGMLFARNPYHVLFFRGLSGVAAGCWVAYTILYANYFPSEEASNALGKLNAWNSLGKVIATFLGGLVAEYFNIHFTFKLSIAATIIAFILSLFLLEPKYPTVNTSFLTIFKHVLNRNLLFYSFLAVLVQLIVHSTIFGFTPVIATDIGATSFQLGVLTTIFTIPQTISSAISYSFFGKRLGINNSIILGFALLSLMSLSTGVTQNIFILYLMQILGGFGYGIVFPLLMGASVRQVNVKYQGTAMGIFQSIYGLGMFIGPFFVGILQKYMDLKFSFFIIFCIGILSSFMIFYSKRWHYKN